MPVMLKTFTFTLVFSGANELTEDIANALYEAGCDDAGVGSCDGVLTVDFDRDAESLGDAIGSAIKAVERAGFTVARVEVARDRGQGSQVQVL
jgi:hypothetical protein